MKWKMKPLVGLMTYRKKMEDDINLDIEEPNAYDLIESNLIENQRLRKIERGVWEILNKIEAAKEKRISLSMDYFENALRGLI